MTRVARQLPQEPQDHRREDQDQYYIAYIASGHITRPWRAGPSPSSMFPIIRSLFTYVADVERAVNLGVPSMGFLLPPVPCPYHHHANALDPPISPAKIPWTEIFKYQIGWSAAALLAAWFWIVW